MIPLLLRRAAAAKTPRRPDTRPGEATPIPPAPAPASGGAGGQLRCLWYGAVVADTLAAVDEFLRTPAGTAALADFCRARRGVPEAGPLIDTVGRTAARMRA